jgi:hypothetical protein
MRAIDYAREAERRAENLQVAGDPVAAREAEREAAEHWTAADKDRNNAQGLPRLPTHGLEPTP